jgi:hypothetical protein
MNVAGSSESLVPQNHAASHPKRLAMEALGSTETLVLIYPTTWHHVPGNHNLNLFPLLLQWMGSVTNHMYLVASCCVVHLSFWDFPCFKTIQITCFYDHRCRTRCSIISCCSTSVFCSDWYWIRSLSSSIDFSMISAWRRTSLHTYRNMSEGLWWCVINLSDTLNIFTVSFRLKLPVLLSSGKSLKQFLPLDRY